jgi:hypothetical protein
MLEVIVFYTMFVGGILAFLFLIGGLNTLLFRAIVSFCGWLIEKGAKQ